MSSPLGFIALSVSRGYIAASGSEDPSLRAAGVRVQGRRAVSRGGREGSPWRMGRSSGLGRAAALGAASGLAGGAAMTAAEKLEQWLTRRPSSYVPAHTLAHLAGL